jgi:copper chaperone CopZ
MIAENTSGSIASEAQTNRNAMTSGKAEATAILRIQGMSDSGKAQELRRAAARLDGILRVDINYILDSVTVKYDANKLTSAQVKEKLAPINHGDRLGPED